MSGSILSKESQQALFGYNGSRHCTEIPGEVKYFTWIHSFQIEKFVEKLYKSRQANFLDPDFPKSTFNCILRTYLLMYIQLFLRITELNEKYTSKASIR